MRWSGATEEAARIAARWTAEGGPGGAIVLFDGSHIHSEAFGGLASLELNLPFTAETVVRYASISKHFCASLLVRLQSEGVLSFDDTLGTHLPALPPALAAVPIARALDMTGGLPDTMETLWLLGVPWTASLDRHALFAFITSAGALNFPPGTEISYSNTGYRLVETALGLQSIHYGEALRERFFRPLGLSIRLPEDETEPVPALAVGYWRDPNGWRRGRYGMHFSASGGLTGSARDLAVWLMALMTGRAPAADLLAPLGARRQLGNGAYTGYGLGLARSLVPGEIAVGHGGSLPGYKNHFLLLPERQAGVVVVSNREDTDAHGIALRVMAALTGGGLPEPAPTALPDGLFAAPKQPCWIEHNAGELTFLGATERLFTDEDGSAVSRSAHLPVRLRRTPDGIGGEIGHVARSFSPVSTDVALAKGWEGEWVCEPFGARCTIALVDGGAELQIGTGPLRVTMPLTPLDYRPARRPVAAARVPGARSARAYAPHGEQPQPRPAIPEGVTPCRRCEPPTRWSRA
jgi:CubicO group peptidase (beta-lactamase class C family)